MVCSSPSRAHSHSSKGRRWPGWGLLAAVLILVGVVACTDNDTGHQFAGDVPTAPLPTIAPTPTPPVSQAVSSAPPVPVAQILKSGGGPSNLFFLVNSALWAANVDGNGAHKIYDPGNAQVRALATTSDGSRAAVLVEDSSGRDWSVIVLDAEGHQQAKLGQIATLFGAKLKPDTAASLAWSPKGDQLLLAAAGGGVAVVPLRGKPQVLVTARQTIAPGAALWSPRGNAIAYLDPVNGGRASALYVAQTGSVPLDPAAVVDPSPSRAVVAFTWADGGKNLLYIAANGGSGRSANGGDIFSITAAGQHPRVLISAGTAGPAAEITKMALSPDGQSIAYTVYQSTGSGLSFLSLWVQRLHSPDRVLLPVPAGQAVTDLWWTRAGLVWRTVPAGASAPVNYPGGAFALYRADSQGNAIRLLRVTRAELATPVPSPVASPAATPVASPGATPVAVPGASPVASPVGSPVATPMATPVKPTGTPVAKRQ